MTTETNKTFEITSTITINPTPKSIIVCFSVCDGDKKFVPNVHSLYNFYSRRSCSILLDDENVKCAVVDSDGNIILEGRKNVDSSVGILEWEEDHLTDVAKYIEDCTDEEIELIMKAYRNHEIEDDDLIELIDNSIKNHKPIKTLEELADYYNVCRDYQLDFADMISENGWHDDTHKTWEICHDGEGNRVEINEEGYAEVIYK